MENLKPKKYLLQAYNISNDDLNSNESNLLQLICKKLNNDLDEAINK